MAVQTRRRSGGWADIVEPLFPRYLFIRLDVEADNTAPIRSTKGVSGLVRVGHDPAVVPDNVIRELQARCEEGTGLHRITRRTLTKGAPVSVVDGAFEGVNGIFEATSGAERVTVLLSILGQERRVTLPAHRIATRN